MRSHIQGAVWGACERLLVVRLPQDMPHAVQENLHMCTGEPRTFTAKSYQSMTLLKLHTRVQTFIPAAQLPIDGVGRRALLAHAHTSQHHLGAAPHWRSLHPWRRAPGPQRAGCKRVGAAVGSHRWEVPYNTRCWYI